MYLLLVSIHVIVCIFLIAVILLQAGRGGGLNEMFGGTAESLLGTQAPTVLKKATEIGAILFIVMSLILGIVTARTSRSLFQQMRAPVVPNRVMPVGPTATAPTAAPKEATQTASVPVQAAPAQAAAEAKPAAQPASK